MRQKIVLIALLFPIYILAQVDSLIIDHTHIINTINDEPNFININKKHKQKHNYFTSTSFLLNILERI